MLIRFNRTDTIKQAYRLYDGGEYEMVIKYCTALLAEPNADPELLLLRGVAYLDRNQADKAVPDWNECCNYPDIAGVAHYYLGDFLSGQIEEWHELAWEHYQQAVEFGYPEGHVGKGIMLWAASRWIEAIEELNQGLASHHWYTKARALSIRAGCYYNLGDHDQAFKDKAESRRLTTVANAAGDPPSSQALNER